jgi:titin
MNSSHVARRLGDCQSVFAFFCCCLLTFSQPAAAAFYTVTTVADSGNGSLRQAILNANGNLGLDTIAFNISGTGPFTIIPASALPMITDPVIIDATTQPGYAGTPLIEINGANLAAGTDGLLISAGGSTVRGLAINRCPRDGIRLQSLGTNVIQANFLGTDPSGTVGLGNGEGGVMVYGSPGNLIGGTIAPARNLISGNQNGIYLFMSTASGNVVSGNYIGTSVTGFTALGNVYSGMEVASSSSNLIGGTSPGAGNVISGNGQSGIYFISAPATGNLVQGNYIGVNANGTAALSNGEDAVTINGVSGNTIGGTVAGARNVLSGNLESGVFIWTSGATSNVIAGNYIGTDKTGTVAIPNYTNGVTLDGVAGNTVGGTNAGALNVISGNLQDGILIYSAGASNNVVLGNYIGPDVTGEHALPNTYGGVIVEGAIGSVVGATNGRNVISGNTGNGVCLIAAGAFNIVAGNYIGTDATGENAMANTLAGVYLQAPSNTIGGVFGAGNVISGNAQNGVFIYGTTTSNNVVEGNFIGTDVTGKTGVGNGYSGVAISNAPANTIGGTAGGAGNVISGNFNSGINLGGNTIGTLIEGNYIGTDLTGDNAVPNFGGGIYFYGSGTNFIGGAFPGAGNIISGNYSEGLSIGDPGANGNTIQGNSIGTKSDGVSPLGNQWHNIDFLDTASSNLIGGSTPAADNRIAYATTPEYDGVRIRTGCLGNFVSRNSIFSNAGWGIIIGSTLGVNGSNMVILTSVVNDGRRTGIQGSLNTYANGQFRIQFYENISPNISTFPGYGEGLIYIGSTNITTGANGQAIFGLTLPSGLPPGTYVSATATDSENTTWEFCADLQVLSPPSINILQVGAQTILVTNPITQVVTTNTLPPSITASWSTNPSGFVLLCSTTLNPPMVWLPATNPITTNGGTASVSIVPSGLMSFYCLLFQ